MAAETKPVLVQPAAAPKPAAKLPETTEGMPFHSNHEIKKESNPFTDRDWRMLVYAWSGLLVRIAIILGGAFSVYQYLQTSEEKRINATFALLEDWQTPQAEAAQRALRARIEALNKQYAGLIRPNASSSERAVLMGQIGLKVMSAEGGTMPLDEFQDHFDRVVLLLNRVASCVEANQCSKSLADDYFRDFSVSFWDYFAPYVRQVRKAGSSTYSGPLEQYVTGRRPDFTATGAAAR